MPPWNGGCDSGPREVDASRLTEDADPPLGPKVVDVIHDDDSVSPSRCYESQSPLFERAIGQKRRETRGFRIRLGVEHRNVKKKFCCYR